MNGFHSGHFELRSVRPFDKLRAGSEPVEGLREGFSATARRQSVQRRLFSRFRHRLLLYSFQKEVRWISNRYK